MIQVVKQIKLYSTHPKMILTSLFSKKETV